IKKSFESITKTSCIYLKRKTRYHPDTFIHRTFAESFFEGFMQSGKTAAMLVAPSGYGKSALLLQWMNTHFTGKNKKFKNDVVCLMDGGLFFSYYNQAQENELLTQLLDFDFKTIHKLYEQQEASPKKERYFLIIDDVDRVYSVRSKYYLFAENIMRLIMLNQHNPWFKVILTSRPENLDIFAALTIRNPLLAEAFYEINFLQKNQHDIINVPLFSNEELKKAFSCHKLSLTYYNISLYYPDIMDIINTPRYFSFLVQDANSTFEDFKEIKFVNHLIQHFYYSHPFAEEKQQLIKKFLHLCGKNNNHTFVNKDLLLEKVECPLAYQELINAGLLYEYLDTASQPEVQLNVRFSGDEIFEYLLAWSLVKEQGLNQTLIDRVYKNYHDVIHVQYSLLRWIVKIAFFENDVSFLKQLHQSMESRFVVSGESGRELIPGALRVVQRTFIECYRTNSKISEILLPEFAKTKLGQKLFFEENFDLDNLMNFPEKGLSSYEQNNKTADGEMVYHFIQFAKGFYLLDVDFCSAEFKKISQINFGELKTELSLGYYFSSWFLYASLNDFRNRKDMLKKFLATSGNIRSKNLPATRLHPGFELFVMYHLNACDFFEECRTVAKYLIGREYAFSSRFPGFYQYFRLCYARSLFHTGEQKLALEIYREIDHHDSPYHLKHFMLINFNLARYDFLEFQNQTAEGLSLLHETKLLANQMGYRYYVLKAEALEIKLLKANNG
ncbi:MAG: hypothetical protein ACOC11_01360, partial [Prolixibacteraceae bacterium]